MNLKVSAQGAIMLPALLGERRTSLTGICAVSWPDREGGNDCSGSDLRKATGWTYLAASHPYRNETDVCHVCFSAAGVVRTFSIRLSQDANMYHLHPCGHR